jgi:hypothetical protein
MTGRIGSLVAAGWLLFACSPAAAGVVASPPAPPQAPEATPPVSTDPTDTATAPPAAPADGFRCAVELEIRDEARAHGTASSATDPEGARKTAWKRACDDLAAKQGLDCEDETRVRVVKRSSSTRITGDGDAATTEYEQTFELVSFRQAAGAGRSPDSRADACRAAADNACQALLSGPCPEGRVTVLRTDETGEPPAPIHRTI